MDINAVDLEYKITPFSRCTASPSKKRFDSLFSLALYTLPVPLRQTKFVRSSPSIVIARQYPPALPASQSPDLSLASSLRIINRSKLFLHLQP